MRTIKDCDGKTTIIGLIAVASWIMISSCETRPIEKEDFGNFDMEGRQDQSDSVKSKDIQSDVKSKDKKTPIDSGISETPGYIPCGSAKCSTSKNYCCIELNNTEKCLDSIMSNCAGRHKTCDETADCSNKLCCTYRMNVNFQILDFNTSCFDDCISKPYEQYQICKKSAECNNGKKCISNKCKGITFSTCGGIPISKC